MVKKLADSRSHPGRGKKPIQVRLGNASKPRRTKGLAHDGDPYVTASGKVIQPERLNKKEHEAKTVRSKSFKSTTKRTIKELPALPGVLRGIACVFICSVLGLSDREIAEVLGISTTDVRTVRSHTGYTEVFDIVSSEFVNANSKLLSARIASYAEDALTNVHEIAMTGTKEDTKLRANIDLLDRGGVRPKDVEQRRGQEGNELRITITKGDSARVEVNGITVDNV